MINLILLILIIQQLFSIATSISELNVNATLGNITWNIRDEKSGFDVDLSKEPPFLGDMESNITVVEFGDFTNNYCGAVEGTNMELINFLRKGGASWEPPVPKLRILAEQKKIKFVFRSIPREADEDAMIVAEAAECAHKQGKFWEYHDLLFANQDKLSLLDLKDYAQAIGLDLSEFKNCLDSREMQEKISDNLEFANNHSATRIPSFLVNGENMPGMRLAGFFIGDLEVN